MYSADICLSDTISIKFPYQIWSEWFLILKAVSLSVFSFIRDNTLISRSVSVSKKRLKIIPYDLFDYNIDINYKDER
jgi:hypothetical protein